MTSRDNLNDEAVTSRIIKAGHAWGKIRTGIITEKDINARLRISLIDSLIGSILLYRLQIIPDTQRNIHQLQSFYSKCIRLIADGSYYGNNRQRRN